MYDTSQHSSIHTLRQWLQTASLQSPNLMISNWCMHICAPMKEPLGAIYSVIFSPRTLDMQIVGVGDQIHWELFVGLISIHAGRQWLFQIHELNCKAGRCKLRKPWLFFFSFVTWYQMEFSISFPSFKKRGGFKGLYAGTLLFDICRKGCGCLMSRHKTPPSRNLFWPDFFLLFTFFTIN